MISQSKVAQKLYSLNQSVEIVKECGKENEALTLTEIYNNTLKELEPSNKEILDNWAAKKETVRG